MTTTTLSLTQWRFLAAILAASVVAPFASGVTGAFGLVSMGERFNPVAILDVTAIAAVHVGFLGWWLGAYKLETRRYTWASFALLGAAVGVLPSLLFFVFVLGAIDDLDWALMPFIALFTACGVAGGLAFYWTYLAAARTLRLQAD